ncbi:MAG: hypothetical protein NVS2B14_10650 [Chamaesiphon sp.]
MVVKSRASKQQKGFFKKTSPSKLRLFAWLMPILIVLLWLGYKQMESYFLQPKAIFVLGGATEREKFAAEFARHHPNIPIWVSSGSPKRYAKKVFVKAGIDLSRVHLDYQAVDTVTNFTSLVKEFKAQGIDSVYLITSDYHMRRARIIGEIVFGSRGIIIKPVSIPTGRSPESIKKAIRDGARAIVWVTTGYTGASLGESLESKKNPSR